MPITRWKPTQRSKATLATSRHTSVCVEIRADRPAGLAAIFKQLGPEFVRGLVRDAPTGSYARKAWFLYEYLVGQLLDLPDAKTGAYTDVLDARRHIVGARRTSSCHRVWDNLLGVPGFTPTVRRTRKLTGRIDQELNKEVAF